MMWNFRIASLLLVIADASEIAILPNAHLDTCPKKTKKSMIFWEIYFEDAES